MNDKEIIRRCQNGDRAAFDTLIREFYPYVTKYLLKLTHDENLTEDLTQEVFLKVIRTIEEYKTDGKAAFATYIITIAKTPLSIISAETMLYYPSFRRRKQKAARIRKSRLLPR